MINIERLKTPIDERMLSRILKRQVLDNIEAMTTVTEIVGGIAAQGDIALLSFCRQYDRVEVDSVQDLRVSENQLESAHRSVEPEFIEAIKRAKKNITVFHSQNLAKSWKMEIDGSIVGQQIRPLNRVGAYVPGGLAAYPSTALMTTIPAKAAGVEEIVVCCPPGPDGEINQYTLAAIYEAGVGEVYRIGGAQAIAAMAYGTETIQRVDKICGPGNIYVTLAKSLVIGAVGIDMLAGPSEVVIIADETAEPDFIAADMFAQAEHDPNASAYLVCTSEATAKAVLESLNAHVGELDRHETVRASLIANGHILVVSDLEAACALTNMIAPEHLELCTREPEALLDKISNAGAIFIGNYTPEAVGDYIAGPNHVLPTAGTARFASPLSTDDFLKRSSILQCSRQSLESIMADIDTIARAEGLDAHARSATIRTQGPSQ